MHTFSQIDPARSGMTNATLPISSAVRICSMHWQMLCYSSSEPEDNDERVDRHGERVAILSSSPGHNDQATDQRNTALFEPTSQTRSQSTVEKGRKIGHTHPDRLWTGATARQEARCGGVFATSVT